MVAIGVAMPALPADAAEFLADGRALDAAGANSLWLEERGQDRWMTAAALAAVTGRVRLVVPVGDAPGADLAARAQALGRLSRGRGVLIARERSANTERVRELAALAAGAGSLPLFVELLEDGLAPPSTSPAQGCLQARPWTVQDGAAPSPQQAPAPAAGQAPSPERWVRVAFPANRDEWRRTLQGCEAGGVTGVLVPFDERLLDLLRRGDEDDDRSDLVLAQG